jgi:hypothetical protein
VVLKYYGLSSVGQELLDPFKGILSYSVEFHFMKIQDAVDLQNDLSSLEEWERKWYMCFHPEKCIVSGSQVLRTEFCWSGIA